MPYQRRSAPSIEEEDEGGGRPKRDKIVLGLRASYWDWGRRGQRLAKAESYRSVLVGRFRPLASGCLVEFHRVGPVGQDSSFRTSSESRMPSSVTTAPDIEHPGNWSVFEILKDQLGHYQDQEMAIDD